MPGGARAESTIQKGSVPWRARGPLPSTRHHRPRRAAFSFMANETVSQWGNHVPEVMQQVKGKAATITIWFDLNMKSLSSLLRKT